MLNGKLIKNIQIISDKMKQLSIYFFYYTTRFVLIYIHIFRTNIFIKKNGCYHCFTFE